MIRSTIEIEATGEDHRLAKLAALSIGLSALDSAIFTPIPGIKPGLANIVVLVVLSRYGFKNAVWVSLLRVLGGALFFGSFLSPGFFLSFAGAISSLFALYLASHLPQKWFGPVTSSIFASFAHIAGQFFVAYFWLIPHAGIFSLFPFFALSALFFGALNGIAAARILGKEKKVEGVEPLQIQCGICEKPSSSP